MEIIASALMGIFLLPGLAPVGTVATTSMAVDPVVGPINTPSLVVKVTSYNAVPSQTDGTPFITASGAYSNSQVVAARSRDLADTLPFGTIVSIEIPTKHSRTCGYGLVASQVGYRVIADTMNIHKHNQVDVLLNQRDTVRVGNNMVNPSIALGICHGVAIRVVGHIRIRDIPHTQTELAKYVVAHNTTRHVTELATGNVAFR